MLNNHDNKKKLHTRGGYRLNVRVFAALMAAMLALTTLGASLPEEGQTAQTSSAAGESLSENKEQTGAERSQKPSEGKPEKSEETQNSDGENTYTYSAEVGGVKVTAKAKAGVLPKDVSLAVTPVEKNSASSNSNISYEDIENKVRANLAEGRTLSGLLTYDISFFENGQRKEPDGTVELHFSWDKAGAPENAGKDDKVRLLHFAGSDGDLANATVDDLTDSKKTDNTATVSVNNENKLTRADATVGSFSVFAFAWEGTEKNGEAEDNDTASKDNAETSETDANGSATASEATNDEESLAAASQNTVSGNGVSGNTANQSDTSDISANKNTSDESAASNNTTGENTVGASDTSETAGTDAQSQRAESGTKKQNDTRDQSVAKAEKTGKEKTEKLTGEDSNHKYTVTVSYDKTAKIPAGTSLKVKELSEKSQSYKDAKTKTLKSLTDAGNSEKEKLGFAALDISLVNAEGREIEPKADVKVEIRLNELPDGVSDGTELTVKHITDEKKETFAEKVSEGIHSFISGEVEGVKTVGKPVTVKNETVPVVGGQVSGFSVFTLTWTKSADDATRIGSVRVRYVDENGLEINTDSNFDETELGKLAQTDGGVVDLSTWANKDGNSRVSGYTYDHAVIGSRNGTTITGVKVEKSVETQRVRTGYEGDYPNGHYTYEDVAVTVYRLYYTTDSSVNTADKNANNWTLYKDSGSETYANNANIFLVYKKDGEIITPVKPITIHYMTLDGQAIQDGHGNALTRTIDGADISGNLDFLTWAKNNVPDGYAVKTLSNGTINGDNASDATWVILGMTGDETVTNGSITGKKFRYLKYAQENSDTKKFLYAGRGNARNPTYSDPGKISDTPDIYITYEKKDTNQLTLHYQYVNKSGSYSDAYYNNNTTKTITVKTGRNYLVSDPNNNGAYVDTIYEGNVKRPAASGESEPQPVIFMSSHLGGADGPIVNSVDVTDDGKLVYHTSMEGTADPDDNSTNPTSWTLSQPSGAQRGRSIVITKDNSGNLQLRDSMNGDALLSLVNDEAETGSDIPETYKATLQNENYTVEYMVTEDSFNRTASDGTVTRVPRYGVEVLDSYPSTATDIYQIYIDGDTSTDKLWVEDDMKYSGLFRTDVSDSLQTKLNTATNISYEWHRITIPSKEKVPTKIDDNTNSNYETVLRKSSGEHWNIALDADKATWLDIEADEGNDVWKAGTTHAYYVKLTYTPRGSSTSVNVYSTPLTVNYYGQLENGSFETPVISEHNTNNTSTGFQGGQTSNEWYKNNGGVWQTTGPGSSRAQSYAGRDIEIVNGADHAGLKRDYHWQQGNASQTSWAAEGNQFAELNAENAGALYQDVITHPNENINFWVSHRARGSSEADGLSYKFDTMYVVIMPTKLAMTLGNNGTELTDQTELQNFISSHGGFDSSPAYSEVEKRTYYDEDSGILVYKVSSGEDAWHTVNVINNYKAKGGLTRFFFCAASTAGDLGRNQAHNLSDPPTQGNFIDNVGFSQSLPPTKGFNLTVTETFSGITLEQLAGLASNAKDYDGKNGISAQNNPLQVTLTNSRSGTSGTNTALSRAKLGFTIGYDNDQNLVLTPTATASDGVSLFESSSTVTKPGSGDVHQYSDGRIVITWTFPDQLLAEGTGQSTDQHYNYTANDNLSDGTSTSTTDIRGFSKTTSRNAVDNKATENNTTQGTSTNGSITSEVFTGADKTLNIINVYSPNVHISVRKTFSGVTPSTVEEMMNGTGMSQGKPYSITISKGTNTKTLKVDGGYAADGTKDNSVSVSTSQAADGSTTYKWTITDPSWRDGTYTVKEENYTTNRNSLADITLNGQKVITTNNKEWPSTDQTVTVNENSAEDTENTKVVNIQPTESGRTEENNGVIDLKSLNGNLPDTSMNSSPSTNLVVGQYTLTGTQSEGSANEASSDGSKRYIVWTLDDVGLTTRRAIVNYINSIWGETGEPNKATAANTSFYSGSNVYLVSDGRIARMVHQQSASLSGEKWDKFYAGHISAGSNSSFIDESEIRLENEYTPKIKIQKQSSAATVDANGDEVHERLNGAEFRIYKLNTDKETKLYYSKDGSNQWSAEADNAKVFTTAEDSTTTQNLGSGIALLDSLPINGSVTYYLEETKAPAGYKRISDISFKVRANGTVGLVDEDGNDSQIRNDKVEIVFNDPYYTIVVNDDPGIELPNTGGHGTLFFYLAGGLILAMAGVLFARTKMKQRAGERS